MGVSFVTVGNFNIDNVVSSDGKLTLRNLGGNAVFSAIGAHIWSSSIGIVSVIPINYPELWLQELEQSGIDLTGVSKASPAVDLEEWFFYQADGSRIDHLYAPSELETLRQFGVMGSGEMLSPTQIEGLLDWVRKYPSERGISLSQFRAQNPLRPEHIPDTYWPTLGCHIAPNSYSVQLKMARAFKSRNVLVSLDPSTEIVLSFHSEKEKKKRIEELLENVDVFLPSQKEIKSLYPDKPYREAIMSMVGMGPCVIGVKLGDKGSLIWSHQSKKIFHIPSYPVTSLSLTGAGDAYCGGFLVGMVESGDPLIAACFGSVSASLLIERKDLRMALRLNRYQANRRLEILQRMMKNKEEI
ncbi:MAG: carbohydrate kinase family protein [Candidatus Methanomethylicaceae archaeon]